MKKKIVLLLTAMLLCTFTFASCASEGAAAGEVSMSGSTSMEKLVKALSEEYMAQNPDVTIDVQLGGSSAGFNNVVDGVSDIGNLSRALKEDEKEAGLTEYIVAYDGIAIVVNPANTVSALTIDQLKDIYTGKITNWKEVGGADMEIVVVGREAGSGTRDGFEEIVGVQDQCKLKAELNETGQVVATVASTKGAIGYISLGSLSETVKALSIDGVSVNVDTVKDGSYKIQRPFLMVVSKDNTNEACKAFIDYILSDEGQTIVESQGYVPVN